MLLQISPKDNLICRDHESAHPRNEHTVQSSTIQDMNGIQEKDKTASSDSNLKRKFLEVFEYTLIFKCNFSEIIKCFYLARIVMSIFSLLSFSV